MNHRTEQNTDASVTLTISQWRTVYSALCMAAKACEEAHAKGDTGASNPEQFQTLAVSVWQQGITPPDRDERLRARGWAAKKDVRFVPSEGPSHELV